MVLFDKNIISQRLFYYRFCWLTIDKESWVSKNLSCGVGKDSWESLRLQGDQTSQTWRKSTLNIHWKVWCWSWNSNTLATWCEVTHLKRCWCWERLRKEEKGRSEDEMVGWHHWLNGHEFEQALGVGDGQGSLVCCSPWSCRESYRTEKLNWTELNWYMAYPADSKTERSDNCLSMFWPNNYNK